MRNETFRVAGELGQPQVVSDMEFFMFVAREPHRLGLFRRFYVWFRLRREPWSARLAAERRASETAPTDRTRLTVLFDEAWEEVEGDKARPPRESLVVVENDLETGVAIPLSALSDKRIRSLRPVPGIGGVSAPPGQNQSGDIKELLRQLVALGLSSELSPTARGDHGTLLVQIDRELQSLEERLGLTSQGLSLASLRAVVDRLVGAISAQSAESERLRQILVSIDEVLRNKPSSPE